MQPIIEGVLPPIDMPRVIGDYNARGLSGDASDNCIYWLNADMIACAGATTGSLMFVYEVDEAADGSAEVFGFVCALERVPWAADRWRGRPHGDTWYRGPPPWGNAHDA